MIYLSIDLETTGVDWEDNNILEFGAIIEDTKKQLPFDLCPKFDCLLSHQKYIGQPYALAMHKDIFEELYKKPENRTRDVIPFYELSKKFKSFLINNGFRVNNSNPIIINVAGKNFGTFDMRFLEKIPHFKNEVWFKSRVIDPAVLYYNESIDVDGLPNLSQCKERAGIENTDISHNAIADAWDVIQVLRGKMYPKIN